jgi:hypothetical protein
MLKGAKILLACLSLAVGGYCGQANAAATLTLYDGVNPLIVVTDNGPGDSILSPGIVYVQTNIGVWYLSISSAVTKPVFGSATSPVMDLIIQANSSAAGSLTFTFSDNGFGPASGTLNATVDGHTVSGAPTAVAYDVWGDPANVVGATTVHIAGIGPVALPASVTGSGSLSLPAPYSLTQVLTFTTTGATGLSADASFNVVPEPGVLALGLLGIGLWAARKLQAKGR